MSNVVLSIDGRKEINDKMRPHRGGQGSYEEISAQIPKTGGRAGISSIIM